MALHQTRLSKALRRASYCILCFLIVLSVVMVQDIQTATVNRGIGIPLSSDQSGTVSRHGYPDSFSIIITRGDPANPGRIYRLETWNYYRQQQSIVFVNGMLKGPVSSVMKHPAGFDQKTYRPEQFINEMTWQEVQTRILGRRAMMPSNLPRGYQVLDLGGILLGFENGRLVYVDTTPPETDEE